MNIAIPIIPKPDRSEAEAALDTLRAWAASADETELATLDPAVAQLLGGGEAYPLFKRDYPADFEIEPEYKASLPDLQNGPSSLIKGANQQIQHVGISNFRLPVGFATRDNGPLTLQTSVTGTVSLEADKKGINMSRIMRSCQSMPAPRAISWRRRIPNARSRGYLCCWKRALISCGSRI